MNLLQNELFKFQRRILIVLEEIVIEVAKLFEEGFRF